MSVQSLNKTIACAFALFLSLSAPVFATEGGGDASWRASFESSLTVDLTDSVPQDIWNQIISMDENLWQEWRYVSKFYNEKFQQWKKANEKPAPWQKWNMASCDVHLQERNKSCIVNIGNKVYFQWGDTWAGSARGQQLACLELDPTKKAYYSEKDVKSYTICSGINNPCWWITNLLSHHGRLYLVNMQCNNNKDGRGYLGSETACLPLASELKFKSKNKIKISGIPLTKDELTSSLGDRSYSGKFRYASRGSKLICTFTSPEFNECEPTEEQVSHLFTKVIVFDSEDNTKQIMDAVPHEAIHDSTYIPYMLTPEHLADQATYAYIKTQRHFIETDRYVYFPHHQNLECMDKTDYKKHLRFHLFSWFFAHKTFGSVLVALASKNVNDDSSVMFVIVHDPKTNKLYSRNLHQEANYTAQVLFDGERLWVLNFESDGQDGLNLKTIHKVDLDPHILLLLNPDAKQADIL